MSELTIQVKAITEEAINAFKNIGDKIGDLSKKAEGFSSTSKIAFGSFIGSLASQATAGAFNLFRDGMNSSIDFLKESASASAEAEVALNQLNTSMALAGKYSKESTEDFVKFAESLQATTTFEDDLIIKNAAMLQSFAKLDSEGLKAATKAALDFSAGSGRSLEETMSLLQKASVGSTEMLSRYGIVINKTGDSAKDFKLVLETINKQFGGAAEAQVNTFTGAMTQLENVYGNFKESIGDLLTSNPLVIEGIKALKDIFLTLTEIVSNNKEEFQKLVGEGFLSLISLIPTFASGIASIVELFGNASAMSNFFADKILALVQTFYEYQKAAFGVHASVQKFFGGQAELTNKLIADTEKSIGTIEKAREANDQDAANKINNAQAIAASVQDFASKATETLTKHAEKAKELSNSETQNYLSNLSKKNEGSTAANKNEEKMEQDRAKRIENNRKTALKFIEDTKRVREQQNKQIEGVLGGGVFGSLNADISKDRQLTTGQQADLSRNQAIGMGAGIASSVLGGSNGAKDLLVGGATAVANAILPGLGQAVGPIIGALAQGPDAVKGFIRDFVKSVPILITNLVEAIPAVFEALIEQIPVLLDSLVASLPRLIDALVNKLPIVINSLAMQMPFIATEFAISIVKNIPAIVSGIAAGAYNAIVELFNQLNPFSSDSGAGGLISDIGGFLGFAEGGSVKKVPNGFPNDSFPARLTEGELIVDKSNTQKLEQFLNSQNNSSDILVRILDAVSSPMTVESNVQVNQQTFANIILELSRQNRRLA